MRNQKIKLTKTVVADATARDKEYFIWDSGIAGFGLRVRPSGAKSYVFVYRSAGGRSGKVRRLTIKASSLDKAREQAKALSGKYHGGADPAADKAEEKRQAERVNLTPTVGSVLDRFIADHAREHLKPQTAGEYERIVDKILKLRLGKLKINALEPKHVAEMYHAMRATPTQATQAVRVLSSAMSWAMENGLRPAGLNPASIRLKGTRRRQRLFSDVEVGRLLTTIDTLEGAGKLTASVALALRLLFATGCRSGEICGLQWQNVDLEEGVLRWPDSKTGYLQKPITDEARALLEGAERTVGVDWVCPSPVCRQLRREMLEAGFERVMKVAKVPANENASLHLIRHWFASKIYTDKSIPLPLQMAIVGHTNVATAMRYSHVTIAEVQEAAAGAAKRRAGAIKAAESRGKVVSFPDGA
jgi:integrase